MSKSPETISNPRAQYKTLCDRYALFYLSPISKWKAENDVSLKNLALLMKVRERTLSHWLRGTSTPLSRKSWKKIDRFHRVRATEPSETDLWPALRK
jgi:hypothetical protein